MNSTQIEMIAPKKNTFCPQDRPSSPLFDEIVVCSFSPDSEAIVVDEGEGEGEERFIEGEVTSRLSPSIAGAAAP